MKFFLWLNLIIMSRHQIELIEPYNDPTVLYRAEINYVLHHWHTKIEINIEHAQLYRGEIYLGLIGRNGITNKILGRWILLPSHTSVQVLKRLHGGIQCLRIHEHKNSIFVKENDGKNHLKYWSEDICFI